MSKLKNFIPFVLGLLFCFSGNVYGIKSNPKPVTVVQPDGSSLTVRIHGDENFHYMTTVDGFLIRKDKDGFFKYDQLDAKKGVRLLSAQRVSNVSERSSKEQKFVSGLTPVRKQMDFFMSFNKSVRKAPEQILSKKVSSPQITTWSTTAESQYLVILVNFKDKAMSFHNEDFTSWLNEPGFSVDGGTGSVKDYFRDNSMGKFIPNFTVLGPYTLAHEQTYYAANDESAGGDVNPRDMVVEALTMAKASNPDINFAQFDNDGDGFMDNVNIIYAGYSEATTGNEDDMWPHSWTLGDQAFQLDGITCNNYSCSAELVGASGTKMDGIGTFTHEFGHILGLKDMYDTDDYVDGYGIDPGAYSLYASGSYNNDSRTPPCLMAFERMQMGWCSPKELKNAEDVELKNIADNEARYIDCQPDRDPDTGVEWFVLENRQQTGWDTYIPAHGLLIYHYDYTDEMVDEYWSINGPNNNAKHRCMYIMAADGVDDTNSRSGDTYPGRSGNTEFTSTSNPAAINWNGDAVNVDVTNINESNGLVYFQVNGGVVPQSIIRTEVPSDIRDTSIVADATIVKKLQDVKEMGFCWALNEEPTMDGNHISVPVADEINANISGLEPGSIYNIRAYMVMADNSVVYGASIPVTTECKLMEAPFVGDFSSWTNGELDCWKIVDNNGDGTTWIYDESAQAIVYQFDYWNDADDWLISCRMKVPENGALYFVRGVTETTTVEDLDVYVSTTTRNVEDFHLVKRFSFADNFGVQVPEEVDLKEYAGKEIYVAFVCKSKKLQTNLWLWQIYLAEKLGTPEITKFAAVDGGLTVNWTPVKNATNYYLEFDQVTDEVFNNTVFVPLSDFKSISGNVYARAGSLSFYGDGVVETRDYPDGITDCKFILETGGPFGSSTLKIEGTVDGKVWESVGPAQTISSVDTEGSEVMLENYVSGKKYRKLRFTYDFGGRTADINYLTLSYDDGYVWNSLAGGSVEGTSITINETTPGEFLTGKTYVTRVTAGDDRLYYDTSEPVYFTYDPVGVAEIGADELNAVCHDGTVVVTGLEEGDKILCTTSAGQVVYFGDADASSCRFAINGYKGLLLVQISGHANKTFKLMVK